MFRKLFDGYRNKSRQAGKLKWMITSALQAKARHVATFLQSKSRRVPVHHLKWYLGCFCATGLTLSLLAILASGEPNSSTLKVSSIVTTRTHTPTRTPVAPQAFSNYQQAVRMEHYFDSLLQHARTKGGADTFLLHHPGLQDSIRLLKSLYRQP